MRERLISGISPGFPELSQSQGQVTHVLLTRSPLGTARCCHQTGLARLACVKHAASVRPEPGSNSPSEIVEIPRVAHARSMRAARTSLSSGLATHKGQRGSPTAPSELGATGRHRGPTRCRCAGSSVIRPDVPKYRRQILHPGHVPAVPDPFDGAVKHWLFTHC
jgi:hypothetical protein